MRKLIYFIMALTLVASASSAFCFADDAEKGGEQIQMEQNVEQVKDQNVTFETTTDNVSKKKIIVTIYSEDEDLILEKKEILIDPETTIKEVLFELEKKESLDFTWEKCTYIINDIEKQNIDIGTFNPVDGDRIVIKAESLDNIRAEQEISSDDEAVIQEIPADILANAYSKTSEIIAAMASKQNWAFENEWSVIGLSRAGNMNEKDAETYCKRIAAYLGGKKTSKLDNTMSSVNSRLIISLTSLGYDATDVNGKNLLEPLADMDYVLKQGINGPVFALLAFDSHDYEIPEGKSVANQTTRQKLINVLVKSRIYNGGWTYSGSASDVDMTAMVIQALTPYYDSDPDVRSAVDGALEWLSQNQNDDGTFQSGSTPVSSESQSQVLVALTGLGINPEEDCRFIRGNNGVVDGLMKFAASGGGFKHIASKSSMDGLATQQACYALTAYYRYKDGKGALYNMGDVQLQKFSAKPEKGDTGTEGSEEKTVGKALGKTRALGFLSLGVGNKDSGDMLTETAGEISNSDAIAAEKAYNIILERERLKRTLPWVYMAIGVLSVLALVILFRERNRAEQ